MQLVNYIFFFLLYFKKQFAISNKNLILFRIALSIIILRDIIRNCLYPYEAECFQSTTGCFSEDDIIHGNPIHQLWFQKLLN